MADFFIEFTAHIDELRRPENFPRDVYVRETYVNVSSTEHLADILNKRFQSLTRDPGLVVYKDIDAIVDSGAITFDKRVFVPWHMITHFDANVTPIVNPEKPQDPLIEVPDTKLLKETVN